MLSLFSLDGQMLLPTASAEFSKLCANEKEKCSLAPLKMLNIAANCFRLNERPTCQRERKRSLTLFGC
jgi:hypothetical protein